METPKPKPDPDIFEVLRAVASRFWKCKRRTPRRVKLLENDIKKLETEIRRTEHEVERTRHQDEVNRLYEEIDVAQSALDEHPWNDAGSWCASTTGFGSEEIYEAARAEFNASELANGSSLKTVFRSLHKKLRNMPKEWKTQSWASEFFDSGRFADQQVPCSSSLREPAPATMGSEPDETDLSKHPAGQDNETPQLNDIHIKCLRALRALRAKSPKTRKTAKAVAKKVDPHYHARNIKGAMSVLSRAGLVDSLPHRPPKGTPGGSFITKAGLKRLQDELKKG